MCEAGYTHLCRLRRVEGSDGSRLPWCPTPGRSMSVYGTSSVNPNKKVVWGFFICPSGDSYYHFGYGVRCPQKVFLCR